MNLKKYLIITSVLIVFLSIILIDTTLASYSRIITSTTEGGSWSDPYTWIGKSTPGPLDNVIINGPVDARDEVVLGLEITNTGILIDDIYGLTVNGDILNNGKILKDVIKVKGNIVNNGEWSGSDVKLLEGEPRSISGSHPILGDILLQDDIIITNSPTFAGNLEFGLADKFELLNDQSLTILGDVYSNGRIIAKNIYFNGKDQGLYTNNDLDLFAENVYFLNEGEKRLKGNIIIHGNLFVDPGVVLTDESYSLTVFGNIFNNGKILRDPIYVAGNIDNNGDWNNELVKKLFWARDDEAEKYEFLITNDNGEWLDAIRIHQSSSSDNPYYKIDNAINQSRTWKVRSLYDDGKIGQWSELHVINAGNLFNDGISVDDMSETIEIKIEPSVVNNDIVNFSDVGVDTFYQDELLLLVQKKVIGGYPDGIFKPDRTINRAELLKIVMMSGDVDIEESIVKSYSDINGDEWFSNYIQTATKRGIVKGYDDGSFKPGALINRAEAIKIIVLALGSGGEESCDSTLRFTDINEYAWFYKYVCEAEKYGILKMISSKFEPAKEITRAEVVYWAGQLINR